MRITLAETGRSREEVVAELRAMKADDADWKNGRVPRYVFKATDAVSELGRDAFNEFFTENALGASSAFHSVKRMEEEVVAIALSLFQAPETAQGFFTSGGTESIIQAVQTCRDWNRARHGVERHRRNLVLPESAHPAFNKAARLMDLEVKRVPVGLDLRADVAALEAAIDDRTLMLVGSAPAFPYGVIDPITDIGRLSKKKDLWLHVDACVGGYLAPFVKRTGRNVPEFDFSVDGVSSLSADLHKFGFTPKPASTVFYRDEDKAKHHPFDFSDWPNGKFVTSTIVGTRPAGGIAGAWATFQFLGIEGYCRIARNLMDLVDAYKAGIQAIDGLKVFGNPHLSIVPYGSDELDIFRVAEILAEKGWLPGLVQKPKAIHCMMSMIHASSLDQYLTEVTSAVQAVRHSGQEARISARY